VEDAGDPTGPEVRSLALSRSAGVVGDPITVEAGISGDASEVEVYVVGENRDIRIPMGDLDGNGVYTGRWETRFWDPGEYSIAVEAKDQFGGVGTMAVPFDLE